MALFMEVGSDFVDGPNAPGLFKADEWGNLSTGEPFTVGFPDEFISGGFKEVLFMEFASCPVVISPFGFKGDLRLKVHSNAV